MGESEWGEVIQNRRVTKQARKAVLARDNWTCVYCGFKADRLEERKVMTVDHIIPRSKGGSNDRINLACACVKCNTTKNDAVYVRMPNGKIYRAKRAK